MAPAISPFSFETKLVLLASDGRSPLFTDDPVETDATDVRITYMNEGAANVIWHIEAVDPEKISPGHRPFLEDKLLRLRKGTKTPGYTGENIIPPLMSTSQVFEHYEQKVKPLFQLDQLVEQIKIATSPSLIASCNVILDNLESLHQRKENRLGWHLANDEFGLLVTSMAPTPSTLKHLEFKPKWLAQSPTAPADSIRCRTCALSAFRNKKLQACPLRLTALNTISPNSKSIITPPPWLAKSPESAEQAETSRPIDIFFFSGKGYNILQTLKQQQLLLDPSGVLKLCEPIPTHHRAAQPRLKTTEDDIARLSMAMTLRDCTILVNVSRNEEEGLVIDGRLADLDPKSGDDVKRLGKWYWDESDLIAQGWYTGTSNGTQGEKEEEEDDEECCLWRDLERKDKTSSN